MNLARRSIEAANSRNSRGCAQADSGASTRTNIYLAEEYLNAHSYKRWRLRHSVSLPRKKPITKPESRPLHPPPLCEPAVAASIR